MAKLFELSKDESTRKVCAKMQVIARASRAREKRLAALDGEKYVFEKCRDARPKRRKCRKTVFAEQCGRTGSIVVGVRVGEHTTCACRRQSIEIEYRNSKAQKRMWGYSKIEGRASSYQSNRYITK